jgi:hypothetical protein
MRTKKVVVLSHDGTKRGGWNVRYYLELRRPDAEFREYLKKKGFEVISEEEFLRLKEIAKNEGFKVVEWEWRYVWVKIYGDKDRLVEFAKRAGYDVITRAKYGKLQNDFELKQRIKELLEKGLGKIEIFRETIFYHRKNYKRFEQLWREVLEEGNYDVEDVPIPRPEYLVEFKGRVILKTKDRKKALEFAKNVANENKALAAVYFTDVALGVDKSVLRYVLPDVSF